MPTAAYCTACRALVFLGEDGRCENGHERPNLRGLYEAKVHRRTGRPMPRDEKRRAAPTLWEPSAPRLAAAAAPPSCFGPACSDTATAVIERPVTRVDRAAPALVPSSADGAHAREAARERSEIIRRELERRSRGVDAAQQPETTPTVTSPEASSAAVGTRTSRAERREARSSEWKRLFSAPQGRHSKPPRRRTVLPLGRTGTTITVVLMLVGALGAAWLVAGFEPFTQLDVPALLALAP